jgi:hypothetical protein
MMSDYEQILITGGGRIACKRCQARSGRTKRQCGKPALNSKAVCQLHGGRSTGPRTKEGKENIIKAKTIHGKETREIRQQRQLRSLEFFRLRDLCLKLRFVESFSIRGRKPSGYKK